MVSSNCTKSRCISIIEVKHPPKPSCRQNTANRLSPSKWTCPSDGSSRPAMMRRSVVFPGNTNTYCQTMDTVETVPERQAATASTNSRHRQAKSIGKQLLVPNSLAVGNQCPTWTWGPQQRNSALWLNFQVNVVQSPINPLLGPKLFCYAFHLKDKRLQTQKCRPNCSNENGCRIQFKTPNDGFELPKSITSIHLASPLQAFSKPTVKRLSNKGSMISLSV